AAGYFGRPRQGHEGLCHRLGRPSMTERDAPHEATRLEELWAGEFGDAYVERNAVLDARRSEFWRTLLGSVPIRTVLEVGCGQGGHLRPIAEALDPAHGGGLA